MRLTDIYVCKSSSVCQNAPYLVFKIAHVSLFFMLCGQCLTPTAAAPSGTPTSHLLPTNEPTQNNGTVINGNIETRGKVGPSSAGASERSNRAHKEIFRLELLRQIKAIDHMKCFPKVLCGLSVDSDKSFGINKSNFVKSYLELMRSIKPPQEGVDERLRTEDEVEGELLWRFSPHNPDRKHHSSFERISSAAMSASVELADSPEYISRGLLDSRLVGDSSISMEKVDRMGLAAASSVESKEKFSSSDSNLPSKHATRMDSSKIPGEKKKKKNSDKSLTAKLTSYFTSWLPEISFGKDRDDDAAESTETEMRDLKRMTRSMNDDANVGINNNNNNWPLSDNDFLSHLNELLESFQQKRAGSSRHGRADEADSGDDDVPARAESAEHEADIYHTAVNIGKRLKDPKQCDYIYNGCPLEYNKILDMISSIRTDIQWNDDTAEAVSHELGLESAVSSTSSTTTTTTSTTTTTTKKPQRKKTRPSTKIMHVLPNGEKVEINFRLGGSEDSDESASAQRDFAKHEFNDNENSSEKGNKGEDELVVVDLGQRSAMSTEEVISSEKRIISNRKGAPVDTVVVKNKSNKRKSGFSAHRKNVMSDLRTGELERSEELDLDHREHLDRHEMSKPSAMASLLASAGFTNKAKPSALKLSGLTLTTNNNEDQPLEISPSYVIIKHQPLSVHTTSLLSPDNLQSSGQQQIKPADRLQTFQLIQNGQQIDADQITDQLKNYIRQNGGIIPKLSLHSSGLITTDAADSISSAQNPFSFHHHQLSDTTSTSSMSHKAPNSNPFASFTLSTSPEMESMSKLSSSSSHLPTSAFKSSLPESPYSAYSPYSKNRPTMFGAVPGRLDSLIQPKTTATTTTSTTTKTTTSTTTTEKIILPGMAETLTLDTDEITDDTVDKLSSQDSIPGWITPSPSSSVEKKESGESEEEKTMLENLNKTYLNDDFSRSKIRYKNPKKRKPPVKANSSRVRNSSNKRNKGTKKGNNSSSASEESAERVVIKHAGPYNSSPIVYKSPLKGIGPHGGAYPYLPVTGMTPNVFPAYPFWRL